VRFEITESLAGSRRRRQSSGLPKTLSGVPTIRATGRDAARQWPWRESRSLRH
jgi:hypothetical protein